jgi:hypothetical protein
MTQTALDDAMAESVVKARKVLDFGVEGLVAGSSPTLEPSKSFRIMRVRGTDHGFFATVPLVPNYFLARRDLSHELLPEDGYVMNRCHVWCTHPHEATVVN